VDFCRESLEDGSDGNAGFEVAGELSEENLFLDRED